ncbi:MAG: hypothetical protein VKJ44_09445 [Synechococcus sp.]|nr:hypothetical protein [Synechococcus sp.]
MVISSRSVLFRISRHTEDLAETPHVFSQRLVALEQRLGSLEEQLRDLAEPAREDPTNREGIGRAEADIERRLSDCRQWLGEVSPAAGRPAAGGASLAEPGHNGSGLRLG